MNFAFYLTRLVVSIVVLILFYDTEHDFNRDQGYVSFLKAFIQLSVGSLFLAYAYMNNRKIDFKLYVLRLMEGMQLTHEYDSASIFIKKS